MNSPQVRPSQEEIAEVFQRSIRGYFSDGSNSAALFYDLAFLKNRIEDLLAAFPANSTHALAIKANPFHKLLRYARFQGVGLEAASLPEVHIALQAGYQADKIVFDSPAKTIDELRFALETGVYINADSFAELERIDQLLDAHPSTSKIGIRINPQIGEGSIQSSSVAGAYSKFGIPLNERYEELKAAFEKYPWLCGVHLHIGSQGVDLDMLIQGVGKVFEFTKQINSKKKQITSFDIGGGLPVYYGNNPGVTNLNEYSAALKKHFPTLFNGDYHIITEFGRYIFANCGWAVSRIEYVKEEKDHNTLLVHLGADMFLRKCYKPDDWHHDYFILDQQGKIKTSESLENYHIAGPLCFGGDIIGRDIKFPKSEPGDYLVIRDIGAYTAGMWSRYNSRQMPIVLAYINKGFEIFIMKERESIEKVLEFWK